MRQFKNFKAIAPPDFRERMITYWMKDEGLTREEALNAYGNGLDELCKVVIGKNKEYKPDMGYFAPEINGTICFEIDDNNFMIPVNILKITEVIPIVSQ